MINQQFFYCLFKKGERSTFHKVPFLKANKQEVLIFKAQSYAQKELYP